MNNYRVIQDLDLLNKRVLLRADLNVPIVNGKVTDNSRIVKLLPTIFYLLKHNAKIIIISHFGRPKGIKTAHLSLEPIALELNKVLKGDKRVTQEVKFCPYTIGAEAEAEAYKLKCGEILLMENLRFDSGEEQNDMIFALKLASLGEAYINDSFSCSHRAHASILAITKFLPSAAGLLLRDELIQLESRLNNPEKPIAAIIGGSKISTKLELLKALMSKVDYLIIAGAMANTFLKAKGLKIGTSLCEDDLLDVAKAIIAEASLKDCEIILPQDAYVAAKLEPDADYQIKNVNQIDDHEMMLDIGPLTVSAIKETLKHCKTIVWNGPLGAFEIKPFDSGTSSIASFVANLTEKNQVVSIAGGGDIVSALSSAKVIEKFSYISTAGGAFLEWLEGKELPGVEVLKDHAS